MHIPYSRSMDVAVLEVRASNILLSKTCRSVEVTATELLTNHEIVDATTAIQPVQCCNASLSNYFILSSVHTSSF